MNILFICTGNTCRSPMAEALLRHKLPTVHVQSAGIFAREGNQANERAIEVLSKKDIKIDHSSQSVTEQLLDWADFVFTMTNEHKQSLILHSPTYKDKYFTLKEYVIDPEKELWGKLERAYEKLEKDRLAFIDKNKKLTNFELAKALNEHLHQDIIIIEGLQDAMNKLNISDPFGGDLTIYKGTFNELEENIDHLIKQIKKKVGK